MDKKITIAQIKEVAQQAYDLYKTNTDGKNADYIPYLANINKNLFGISICLLNGQTIEVGDSEYRFGIESVSKVHSYLGTAPIRSERIIGENWCRRYRIAI